MPEFVGHIDVEIHNNEIVENLDAVPEVVENNEHVQEPVDQLLPFINIENDNGMGFDNLENEDYYSYDEEFSEEEENDNEDLEEYENLEAVNDLAEERNDIDDLREWARAIPKARVTELLQILRRRCIPELPKTWQTFLETGHPFTIVTLEDTFSTNMKYVYFGIVNGLRKRFNPAFHNDGVIDLVFHFDGSALYKGSPQVCWPLLCRIHSDKSFVHSPFPVFLYTGTKKPGQLGLIFREFIDEMNALIQNGVLLQGIVYQVRLKCFIADTPARALLKGTKGHTGFCSCERCTIRGAREQGTTVFVNLNEPERTHASFVEQSQPAHHNYVSPLLQIVGIDMIDMFILDVMHLGPLGTMKKLLEYWVLIPGNAKLSRENRIILDSMLQYLRNQVPKDFQRKTQSVTEIVHWKATQYNFFLLYAGIVVMEVLLPENMFKHFLLLFTAFRILCSSDLAVPLHRHAKVFLRKFVELMPTYYGPSSVTLNFHNLIHVADDVKNLNCNLHTLSAFAFESLLGKMRKTLRSGYKPMEQLCYNMYHMFFVKDEPPSLAQDIQILKQHSLPRQAHIVVKEILYKNAKLTTKFPNNFIMSHDDMFFEIKSMRSSPDDINNIVLSGYVWEKEAPYFTYPVVSSMLGIYKLQGHANVNETSMNIRDVATKIRQTSRSDLN